MNWKEVAFVSIVALVAVSIAMRIAPLKTIVVGS